MAVEHHIPVETVLGHPAPQSTSARQDSHRYFSELAELLAKTEVTDGMSAPLPLDAGIDTAVSWLSAVRGARQNAMLVGNGGSAAIAGHLQVDLINVGGIKATAFAGVSTLTAMANDYGYQNVYARQIQLWGDRKDILIAISSSGQSKNILAAVTAAIRKGCHVITFSGFDANNPLRRQGGLNFYVPSSQYGPVELAHGVLTHYLTDKIAQSATGSQPPPSS